MKDAIIAVDFGGGSGRVIAGVVAGDCVELREIHRFANRQVRLGGHTYWNFLSLFDEMIVGLRKAAGEGLHILSLAIDTWGVDFGLIDSRGRLMGNPVCYRDANVSGAAESFFLHHGSQQEFYAQAGVQIMDIDSVFRLARMQHEMPEELRAAGRLLFTPDLFSYFLTGTANNEYTIATTSGLIDARTRNWNRPLIDRIGLPQHLFSDIVMPGMVRGLLTRDVMAQIGVDYDVPVIAVGSHDTASAVHATGEEFESSRTAYLSSGTWSLLGVNIGEPILTDEARLAGFTNEGATGGRIRFLQNITGLWIFQKLIEEWRHQGLPTDYPTLLAAAESEPSEALIDVDDQMFHAPQLMTGAIEEYCRRHEQQVPATQGQYVSCVMRSLAMRYKKGIDGLNRLLPYPVEKLRIIGGGSRNALLNRLTAEATGLQVEAGPVEATAIGNIMMQAQALGLDKINKFEMQ